MMMKKTHLYFIAVLFLAIVSCSKDDDEIDLPTVDDITEVVITPTEVRFNEIGQTQEFSAKAYNKDGLEIGAKFNWTSSNTDVVVIRPNGIAEAVNLGDAMIYVTVNEITDSAEVIVDLDVDPSIWWMSATNGDWSEASNWSTGVVPSATDTVAIILEGDYTVTLSEDVTVGHLMLGATDGIQKLATGTNQFTIESGTFTGGAEIQVDGTTTINGEVEWKDGDITGAGMFTISSSANVVAGIDSQTDIRIKVPLTNSGVFAIVPGANIKIDDVTFENTTSGIIDILGDYASIYSLKNGIMLNYGNLVKSAGLGKAYIQSSGTAQFVNKGYLSVESGTLYFYDGELDGVINIEENAALLQNGYTILHSGIRQRGDGVFEIDGEITLGQEQGELIRLENISLSGFYSSSITGPGDLSVNGSFVWNRGTITGDGKIITYGETLLQGPDSKKISKRKFIVVGTLETESLLNLTLEEGAQLEIDTPNSYWTHNGGGTIKQGNGAQSKIIVYTSFLKKGTGFLNVNTDFSCAGTMYLTEGVVAAEGSFNLQETGKIIGGSADIQGEVYYRRLQFLDSNPAVLAGTIEVDANGEQAYMGILGAVTLESTFKVLVDIKKDAVIPADRLVFHATTNTSPTVVFNGTVDVAIHGNNPPEDVEYRVVSALNATGKFDVINAEWFHEIRQDSDGVLLIR